MRRGYCRATRACGFVNIFGAFPRVSPRLDHGAIVDTTASAVLQPAQRGDAASKTPSGVLRRTPREAAPVHPYILDDTPFRSGIVDI